jgi:tetratricopeptide (TPR) repeat protein
VDQKRIDELKARVSADPDDAVGRFVLLSMYHREGAWDDAVREGQEILKRQPEYIAVYILLGEALLRSGQKEEAREFLLRGKILADKFGHRLPKEGIARLLAELGSPKRPR